MAQTGQQNPNWRGGRSVASNGYVLIRVGKAHHLADVRGYAYEHRLVGEQIVGRRLLPGEEVHHRDDSFEGRSNNHPDNLVVKASRAEHAVEHRIRDDLRMPGEANPPVACECGCGAEFARYDEAGRPRRFVPGHNEQAAPTVAAIRAAVSAGAASVAAITAATGLTTTAVKVALTKMVRRGVVARVGIGRYAPMPETGEFPC